MQTESVALVWLEERTLNLSLELTLSHPASDEPTPLGGSLVGTRMRWTTQASVQNNPQGDREMEVTGPILGETDATGQRQGPGV